MRAFNLFRTGVSAAAFTLAVGASAADVQPPPTPVATPAGWTLTALGTLGGDSSWANGINDAGQVVGRADTSLLAPENYGRRGFNANGQIVRDPYYGHAFLYYDGKMQDLGVLDGESSEATGINSSGQVVGTITGARFGQRAFLFSDGKMGKIDGLGGGSSLAVGINAAGDILGRYDGISKVQGNNEPFLYHGGKVQDVDFDVFFGGSERNSHPYTWVSGLNDAGWIIGYSEDFMEDKGFAFIHHPEGWMEFIGFFPSAINAAGQVVGQGTDSTNGWAMHAILYSGGRERDLVGSAGAYSSARAINASGQVVGVYGPDAARKQPIQGRAFLYRDGKLLDLNDLVGDPALAKAGFNVLYSATGINARGQIVGTGQDRNGHDMAFLLTPPPAETKTPPAVKADKP